MKVYFNSAAGETAPVVIDGEPPADQSALVTQLQADIAALQAKIDAALVAAQAEKDADAASVAGQGVLDALAP
jgi:hypothetical protein